MTKVQKCNDNHKHYVKGEEQNKDKRRVVPQTGLTWSSSGM